MGKTIIKTREGAVEEVPDVYPSVSEGGADSFELVLCDADSTVQKIMDLDEVEEFTWRRR